MSKCSGRGQSDPLPLQCDSGDIKKIYRENNSSTQISGQFTNNIVFDFELKIIKVYVDYIVS